jgi:sterol desaturase/sphingolipid hydroxylase (fatty acid hydroxylase superfamily)
MDIVPFLVHISSFWLCCIYFYKYDKKFIEKSNENKNKYYKAIKVSIINQFCISLPILYFLQDNITNTTQEAQEYTYIKTICNIILIANISNLIFYTIHRTFHNTYFYKKIHYMHHEFIEPVAPSALYAHPLEHIFANTLPFLCTYLYFGCSYYIMLLLLCAGSFITTIAHTNHDINFFDTDHIFHHKYFKVNFGFGGYIDKFFNTYYDSQHEINYESQYNN